jgi:hypothetical protein
VESLVTTFPLRIYRSFTCRHSALRKFMRTSQKVRFPVIISMLNRFPDGNRLQFAQYIRQISYFFFGDWRHAETSSILENN